MRVLLFDSLRGLGGGEEWFLSATRLLTERGHHALLAARAGSALAAAGRERGLPVTELPLGGVLDPRSLVLLHGLLAREHIEVVVSNLDKELRLAALAGAGLGPIALVPRRGSDDRIKNHALNRWLYGRRVTRMLVNSSAIADTLSASMPALPRARIAILPNGVDPVTLTAGERAQLEALWPSGAGPRLITVGEVSRRKNQAGIVRALARIEAPWRLLVVGDGAAMEELRAEIARLDLGARVHLAGHVNEARRLTACADLSLHFSASEGQPWAVLEALAQGVPTIATRLPGVASALADGETGLLVAPGDEDGLARAITRLLGDPAFAQTLGGRARAHIAATHSDALLGDRLETLLEGARLLARSGARNATGRRAVFLDRDGTLLPEAGALGDPARVRLLPGVGRALRLVEQTGYAPVVVTNQAAIGRGTLSAAAVRAVHARLRELVRAEGVELAGIFVCPHRPEDACACRKPAPGLVLDAAGALGLDLAGSWLVGDTAKDVDAARNAGVRPVLLASGWGGAERLSAASHAQDGNENAPGDVLRARDLLAFAERLAGD